MALETVTLWAWAFLHHGERFKAIESWRLGGVYMCWFWVGCWFQDPLPYMNTKKASNVSTPPSTYTCFTFVCLVLHFQAKISCECEQTYAYIWQKYVGCRMHATSTKVDNNEHPYIQWNVVRCGSKNQHQRDTCFKED